LTSPSLLSTLSLTYTFTSLRQSTSTTTTNKLNSLQPHQHLTNTSPQTNQPTNSVTMKFTSVLIVAAGSLVAAQDSSNILSTITSAVGAPSKTLPPIPSHHTP
jgi:hypothetical protein